MKIDDWLLVFLGMGMVFLAAAGVFAGYKLITIPKNTPTTITSIMSPCQCKMSGGCSISFTPKVGLYSDGTAKEDYDTWDRYTGTINVPNECRKEN